MKIVIDIPEDVYKRTVFYREFKDISDCVTTIKALENGTPFDRVLEIIDEEADALNFGINGAIDEAYRMALKKRVLALKGEHNEMDK